MTYRRTGRKRNTLKRKLWRMQRERVRIDRSEIKAACIRERSEIRNWRRGWKIEGVERVGSAKGTYFFPPFAPWSIPRRARVSFGRVPLRLTGFRPASFLENLTRRVPACFVTPRNGDHTERGRSFILFFFSQEPLRVAFNLLRWNDVPRTSENFSVSKLRYFSQF